MKKKLKYGLLGSISGILNGLFGAGGGLLVVPMLESQELSPKQAHATSIAVIFPLSVISAALYFWQGIPVQWEQLEWLLPLGIVGAVAGSFILMKVKNAWLKKIFGVVMIISAIRLLFR